jgi:hypothetical protein
MIPWPLGLFYGHLVHFSRFGILYREKIWQPWTGREIESRSNSKYYIFVVSGILKRFVGLVFSEWNGGYQSEKREINDLFWRLIGSRIWNGFLALERLIDLKTSWFSLASLKSSILSSIFCVLNCVSARIQGFVKKIFTWVYKLPMFTNIQYFLCYPKSMYLPTYNTKEIHPLSKFQILNTSNRNKRIHLNVTHSLCLCHYLNDR